MKNLTRKQILELIKMEPKEALEYLVSRGFDVTDGWEEQLKAVKSRTEHLVNTLRLDMLQDVFKAIDKSLEAKIKPEQFKKNIREMFKNKGWYNDDNKDEDKKDKKNTLDTNWRVNLILRHNTNQEYNLARYEQGQINKDSFPYWRLIIVKDNNTTDICDYFKSQKFCFRKDDKKLNLILPARHWGCRTVVRSVNDTIVKKRGLTIRTVSSIPERHRNHKDFRDWPGDIYTPNPKKYNKDLFEKYKEL